MPQLKMFVLAHPAVWTDAVSNPSDSKKKMIDLNDNSKSWVKLNGQIGTRKGIYKIEPLEGHHLMAKVVYEREIKDDYRSVEELLKEDDCLPESKEIPTPVPTASTASLFFDLKEGICYVYTDTKAPPLDTIANILFDLGSDCSIPCKDLRHFEWREDLVTTITRIAVDEGFDPYKVRADLETVKVTAEGDFSDNEDWTRIRDSIEIGKWNTIAFVKSKDGHPMVFGITKNRKKQLSMPYLGDFSGEKMLEEILEMRRIVEKALGCDLRQYCFPEKITTITQFFKNSS